MNLFRCTPDGSLDKQYLRTCAVYKLLERKCIGKRRAIELLTVPKATQLVEIWHRGPLKDMKA